MSESADIEIGASKGDLWRTLWRTHYYAGLLAGLLLVWLAVSGLGILYKGPIQSLLYHGANHVAIGGSRATLEEQVTSAKKMFPKDTFSYVIPGASATDATSVGLSEPSGETRVVWTNPYTGGVTGSMIDGTDLPAFFNRYHGSIFPRTWLMPVPNVAWLFSEGPAWNHVEVGEVVVEIGAGWGLTLAATGLFLWWPRRSSPARWRPTKERKGRKRWRDLHTFLGLFLAGFLMFSVVTGLPWAAFWGTSWQTLASHVTPNKAMFWSDPSPSSATPKLGDMTRFGTPVAWAMTNDVPSPSNDPMPSMPGMHHGGGGSNAMPTDGLPAAVLSLDHIQSLMLQEGMSANATIYPPTNTTDQGKARFGSYVVMNPWPSSIGQQKAMYFDEFTGNKLGESSAKEWGAIQRATEFGVQTHMGTQFGILTRLFMTLGCLLVLWNFFTGVMMWNRRRRGTLGIPRRPIEPHLLRPLGWAILVLGVVYPLWGLSVVVILIFDKYVIQRIPSLRRAFGMPQK